MRFLPVLVLLAACAKIDEPDFGNPLVNVLATSDGVQVLAPTYQMHFRSGMFDTPDLHMPDRLTVGSNDSTNNPNIFGVQSRCSRESNAGIAMFPAFATGTDPLPGNTMILSGSDISLFESGPYIGKVAVRYHIDFGCGEQTGSSVFTFFPHGKIVRADTLISTAVGSPNACNCPDETSNVWAYTSYWSFVPAAVTNAAGDSVTGTGDNVGVDGTTGVCLSLAQANASIGVRYQGTAGEARRMARGAEADAVVYDLLPPGATSIPATSVDLPDQVFSAIQILDIPGAPCAGLLELLSEPTLRIDTGETFEHAGEDGIYDLGTRGDKFVLTAIQPAPADTTVVVELPSDNVRVTQEPPPTNPPLIQREGTESTRFQIVIPDGLSTTGRVIVEPL